MILLVGATGALGTLVAHRLIERGKRLRILVRPGAAYRPLVDLGAEAVLGDLKDRASLDAACRRVKAVVTTANSAMRGGVDNVRTVDLEGNRSLIDAAAAAGVRRFVFVSALGATEDSPVPFMRAKALTEAHLRRSGMPFTILAPDVFMEVWIPMLVGSALQAGEPVTLVGDARRRHSLVSMGDVADLAATVVDHPAAVDRYIPVGGPAAVTWREVVRAFEELQGREIPVRHVQPGEPIPGLPEVASKMATLFETYDSPVDMAETVRTFGLAPTPLQDFVARAYPVVPAPAA